MKTIIKSIAFSLLLLQFNCSKDDSTEDVLRNQLIGQWQLIAVIGNPGAGPSDWVDVTDGYTYTFNRDGSFISTRFTSCFSGTYSLNGDEISLKYGCPDFTVWFESPDDAFIDRIIFEDTGNVVLTPVIPACIEECASRFEKISE